MEDKLLKAKELKDLLNNLSKMEGDIHIHPTLDGSARLFITSEKIKPGETLHTELFHGYADDPQKCTLIFLRNFFSDPDTAEHISSPHN